MNGGYQVEKYKSYSIKRDSCFQFKIDKRR